MNQRKDAWAHLEDLARAHDIRLALLQEAKRPNETLAGWQVQPPPSDEARWRLSVPRFFKTKDGKLEETRRWFCSAIASTGDLQVEAREPLELHEAPDGTFACSHPGQFAVANVKLDDERVLTVVSLYGIWDRMEDSGQIYPEATLHRAVSDLTSVFQHASSEYVLVGGDLNIYSYSDGSVWGDRGMTVLSRLAAYGLEICGPLRPEHEARLERCPCPDTSCRHVHTYLHQSKPENRPHQLDFFLATPALRDRLQSSWADPDPTWWTHSDHRPIFASFDI
ncbi:MAG: hypothetical protein FJW86_12790 [Actinobacteria bacterium]|nr:hypothetical protein [Actinomycetota bacterium]